MPEDRLLLVVAYHFPPENAIGGLRPFRFCKYLGEHDYRCHVITAAKQTSESNPFAFDVTHVPDPFERKQPASFSWQAERALRKLLLPGAVGSGWALRAAAAGRRIIADHRGARITLLSTFPPLGSHLAGWKLARETNAPWIADLRDPFPDGQTARTEAAWRWLERISLGRANAVIANTDAARIMLQRRHPTHAAMIHSIPNGFDPDERVVALPIPQHATPILSHVGELYAGRTATPVLESIARLIAAGRLQPHAVSVQLIGPAEPSCLPSPEFLEQATDAGWLTIRGELVPKIEALHISKTSDRLLLIQPHTAVQIPAKLFEYVQIGRPILAYLQRNSPSESILRQSGVSCRIIHPDMDPQTFDASVLEFLSLSTNATNPSPWFDQTFNVRQQTRILAALLNSL